MPHLPHPKIRVPTLKIRRPHLRFPRLTFRRYQAGALWALVALAALATLPSLVPGPSDGRQFGADSGVSARDEAAARYQAWLRGRAAGQDPSASAAAAQQAAAGPGAAAPTPTVVLPTAADNNIPAMALRAYRYAESWASGFDPNCTLSWSVLAGIGRIESNHGRYLGAAARFSSTGDVTPTILGPVLNGAPNTGTIHDTDGGRLDGDAVWDRAVGPMQFIPSTWQSLGRDGNGDEIANPNNLFDAAVSAAGYLCQSGGGTLADQANLRNAIYAYNHSWDYVSAVLSWANFYLQQAGQGSLVEVQVPNGPSSSIQPGVAAGGTGVAPTSGLPGTPGTPGTSGTTGAPATPGATSTPTAAPGATSSSSSTTRPPTTQPSTTAPPTTAPPSSSSTTTTNLPTTTTNLPTTTAPCETTTTSTSSTTTTTTDPSTTTTTPCPDNQTGDSDQTTTTTTTTQESSG